LALLWAAQPVAAQELRDVPCERLHFKIAGQEFASACSVAEKQDSEGRWRDELVVAESRTEFYVVSRAVPISGHTYMRAIKPRRVADAALRDIEDWGKEMRVEGYRAYAFTALPPDDDGRLQCLAFVRNPPPIGAAHPQIVGIYCTVPGTPMDRSAAGEFLQRIEAN
jgi:hypothetical protein